MFSYFKRKSTGFHDLYIEGVVVEEDNNATVHYYGTITLSRQLTDEEEVRYDLLFIDDETAAMETEADGLYNMEMRLY